MVAKSLPNFFSHSREKMILIVTKPLKKQYMVVFKLSSLKFEIA
jgi:hypothetical protein